MRGDERSGGCGRRGRGIGRMRKGDSCDANPLHPHAHTHIHTYTSSSNQCASLVLSLSSFFSFALPLSESLVVVVSRDTMPIIVIWS